MSHDKAYHQQVKEAFLDPNSKDPDGHSLAGAWQLDILETSLAEESC